MKGDLACWCHFVIDKNYAANSNEAYYNNTFRGKRLNYKNEK